MRHAGACSHEPIGRRLFPVVLVPWPLLLPAPGALADVLGGRDRPAWLAGLGLAAYLACYLGAVLLARRHSTGHLKALSLPAATVLLTVALSAAFGGHMFDLFDPVLSLLAAIAVWRCTPVLLLGAGAVAGAGGGIDWWRSGSVLDASEVVVTALVCAMVAGLLSWLLAEVVRLREGGRERAEIAVARERLRFARDLHDLFGHTMALILIKAESVRRSAGGDPGAVRGLAQDIDAAGRRALTELRQAVTGYRERCLGAELAEARALLAEAGIAVVVEHDRLPLPAETDTLLGWAVREGVTNVIRHSRAGRCEILVRRDAAGVTLRITDDGTGGGPSGLPGNGLKGLAERVAAAGGGLQAAAVHGGGYRLVVRAPVPGGAPRLHASAAA
ncbi:sensor histidine kinase [Actinomadura formosensis]|uniref:sensor histidine kinase n=1 Tax=Actinomadura formosensis TaxID=60706 RepID=UPI003D8F00B4